MEDNIIAPMDELNEKFGESFMGMFDTVMVLKPVDNKEIECA